MAAVLQPWQIFVAAMAGWITWRCPPAESPLCAGDQDVALEEREQKDEEPR